MTSALTGHDRSLLTRQKEDSVNSISSKYHDLCYFFTKVMSQHADSECNSTHLIQCGQEKIRWCGRVDFESEYPVCRAKNEAFSLQQRCRKTDCQVELTSTCFKCELLEISRQNLRF